MAIGILPAVTARLGFSHSLDVAAGLFANLPVSSNIFIYVFFPLLVFEAGIATEVTNRSPPHIGPISGTPKRKLENGEQRLA